MATNSEAKQASVRGVTSTTATFNEDWLALFNARSIGAGSYNERLLAYINNKLSTSYTDINLALQALAENQSANNFSSMGTFTP
jgi:hypothetical protein|tara:strand:+ start:3875 stop:4126 length:252 start_codon:yes stop_codon:yes gene_type:complete